MVWCSKSVPFNPEKDIPSLAGKVILVTGANVGLGKQAVLEYAKHNPRQIWLACRDPKKGEAAVADVKQTVPEAPIKILKMDLGSFDSVKAAAATFLAESDRLDILMLNAGIMAVPPSQTTDGYEVQFGTNHMGHALLTKLLLPVLERTAEGGEDADVRIIALSSHGHLSLSKGDFRFDSLKTSGEARGTYNCYFQSKLANVLWARSMAKLYPQFTVASIHPGIVQTSLMDKATGTNPLIRGAVTIAHRFLTTVEKGVLNQLWASVSKDVESGEYYEPVGVKGLASEDGKNEALADELWNWTEKELAKVIA